jgi:hypothetical protein
MEDLIRFISYYTIMQFYNIVIPSDAVGALI